MSSGPSFHSSSLSSGTCALSGSGISRTTAEPIDGMARPTAPFICGLLILRILPDGFLARTQARGLVLQSWVPQAAILAHVAIGGFVSHCGWNSILESVLALAWAWPLYAEQRHNALQLVRDYGLAVELSVDYKDNDWVNAEEMERGVRHLMGETEEGQKVRERVEEMAETSKKAVEEGGSFSLHWNYYQTSSWCNLSV
ncbi:hypothetical protein MRB53_007199 [Persea americana]|uniref:Uncharacterized protein n=1 Tax=Persea americana TaxID=3435 RepID=A0ACC2MIJ1_PERAE|nr:hypothetical protein MRB53_007199 [Persea americana]